MSMTAAQTALYWREWSAVRRVQPEADRHELHRRALGRDKSSKLFNNGDLDKVLAEFWAISKPGDLNAQMRQQNQAGLRLRVSIREKVADGYWQSICADRHWPLDLELLTLVQLTQLRDTIAARKCAQGREERELVSENEPF